MNKINKALSFLLILAFILTGFPSELKIFAAPEEITLTVEYNPATYKYDISYPAMTEPAYTVVRFNNPDGSLTEITGEERYDQGRVIVSAEFLPDHIYNISMDVHRAGDMVLSQQGEVHYLADMTFTGESFNQMAKMADIEDNDPILEPDEYGKAVLVKSGDNPVIKLNWKVPTLYDDHDDDDDSTGSIINLTDPRALEILGLDDVPISKACFQINMTVGKGSTRKLDFTTDYEPDPDDGTKYDMKIEGKDVYVEGFDDSEITNPQNMLSVMLKKEQGIEPGTEYEFTNIGIIFKNDASEQVTLRRTKLRTDSENRFPVRNIDNAFAEMGSNISSIYTPLQFELTKVDTDKVEVRFRKIVNGVYPELYYQVQYASRLEDLYTQTKRWVKIPASALPPGDYGYEIVNVNITGTTNPEQYFRVVYFDSSSELPRSSSLAVDLRNLGVDSGKPPLPKEIIAEPIYVGRKEVTVPTTELSSGTVEIPASDLSLSFEKPLSWRQYTGSTGEKSWDNFKNLPPEDSDFVFHIILSAYLPESTVEKDTKIIGLSNPREIYLPVKQKRVLVLNKKMFEEDPADPNRIVCTIPGDKLFYDYASDSPIPNENNEDPSEDGTPGDYPTFLVPNTTYFMQIFTSRLEDNDDIYSDLWGDSSRLDAELNSRLSYMSPIVSFTTWPLTEMPVPMPDLQLGIDPETYVDPVTGEMTLDGIRVNYPRILTDVEWQRYTSVTDGRVVKYEIFISRDAASFDETPVVIDEAPYPDEAEVIPRGVTITADGEGNPILPNTVYYIKARSTLEVDGVVIGRSMDTAVKAITTPKIDTGGIDDVHRDPRAPSEFSIAVDANGELLLSDAWVYLGWLHAEDDVTYEMVCTTVPIPAGAVEADYENDPYNLGFLQAYNEFRMPAGDSKLHLDVKSAALESLGLTLSENGYVEMPIRRDFLRPNRLYYFSLRAVRNRGKTAPDGSSIETVSRWITIPVTTRMVKPPAFLEVVRDLEIGFNINCDVIGTTADSMEVHIKKTEAGSTSYVRLNRAEYTCVQDGTKFYFRIYNLESNQWYDVLIRNKANDTWYNAGTKSWQASKSIPIQEKTRDALTEIEVRFEGEDPYSYFLEARTESDSEYQQLYYSSVGHTDYGYETPTGRIMFYREKTKLYVDEASPKYIYYAKIRGKPFKDENGILVNQPLKTNTLYYIKLWARNMDDSLHIGPVTARTDFSQADYDKEKNKDNTIDLFNDTADRLTKKLYWRIDIKTGTAVRVILKDDRVAGLLKAGKESTITVDISGEQADASYYEILIPYKTLEAIDTFNSRLNIKLSGAEITLNKGSIDLVKLKQQAMTSGAKEAMLLLKVNRRQAPSSALPGDLTAASKAYGLQAIAIGSRLSYAEIDQMIFNILKNPDATGPFKYGILDRELTNVLNNLASYSYKSHVDLKDLINSVIARVEVELSRYLKDIIDGGSGLPADFVVIKSINEFPGRLGIKIEYSYQNGYTAPYVNYGDGWKSPAGGKGYVMQYALFRAEKPGEYIVAVKRKTIQQPGIPDNSALSFLSSRYDLSKVFGSGTIYTADPIKGEQAVMLYAVVTNRDAEIIGLTPMQKVSRLDLGAIMGANELTGYMNNQTSVSLAVKLYCTKMNIDPKYMRPSRTITIANGAEINSRLYPYVVLGIDLNLVSLNNRRFDANGRTTIGSMLDMVAKVLEGI
ncbi:MAG: hypothetical protein ACOX4T_06480 [Acetivibrionales bacterium]